MAPFEVAGFSSMDELWARLGQPGRGWPDDVPRLPAGATAADVRAGRVSWLAVPELGWTRTWPELERELGRLDDVMRVLLASLRGGEVVPEDLWEFTRGVHRAAAWTTGVTEAMPLDAGEGPVTVEAVARVHRAALAAAVGPVDRWDDDGVVEWLAWLGGESDVVPYPVA